MSIFVTIPLTVTYLGDERFGVWMTIFSLATTLTFLNLGIGNALVRHVAESKSKDNKEYSLTVVRGLFLLTAVGALSLLILTLTYFMSDKFSFIKTTSELASLDRENLAITFIVIFSIGIPINGIYKILLGLQLSWIVHAYKSVGYILTIILIFLLANIEADPHYLLLASYGVQTLMPLVPAYFIVRKTVGNINYRSFTIKNSLPEMKMLFGKGWLFLVLQMGAMIGWGSDILLVSSIIGAGAAAQYAIAQRLFQLLTIPLSIINMPLWGAYADAAAKKDQSFLVYAFTRSILITIISASILSISIYAVSEFAINYWIDETIVVPKSILAGFAIWKILESTGHAFSYYLYGIEKIRGFAILTCCFCVVALPCKLMITPQIGSQAVVWITAFFYTIIFLPYFSSVFIKVLKSKP